MSVSDRLSLSFVQAAQAQKHVTVNEATRSLDALVHMTALSMSLAVQPSAPTPGDGYILPAGKSGADWDGFADFSVSVFQDNAWIEYAPFLGMTVYVADENIHHVWDGAAWTAMAGGGGMVLPDSVPSFGVNTNADAVNLLAVKSDSILHSHDDVTPGSGDARFVINKATAGNTASAVFQNGFSGRAELGLTGNDDFTIKVSPDGSSFFDGIVIDRLTGSVSFPNTADIGSGTGGGTGSSAEIATTAEAFANGLEARLVSDGGVLGGNLARSTQIVLATNTGLVQIGSADNGNVVEVFANGADFAAGIVTERLFMARGEVSIVNGLSAGAILRSTKGISGASGMENGSNISPMPLGLEGFAGRQFFLFAFRASTGGEGKVYVAAGAVPATVELRNGAGTSVIDSAQLDAFGVEVLSTAGNTEYQVVADQPVFVGVAAGIEDNDPLFYDLRLVPPLSTEIIGYGRSGSVSALYPNTEVSWYRRDGTSGSFSVSPGAPVDLQSVTGASDTDYEPDGCLILRSTGPISAYSGADTNGLEATPYYPLSSLSQRVPIPLAALASGDGGDSGIAIASPYEGTATVYRDDGSVFVTLPLTRGNAVVTPGDQNNPCAALTSANPPEATAVMPGDFLGGYAEADVPIYVVLNSSGNETLLAGMATLGDEIVFPGITPDSIRARIVQDQNGFLRRSTIDANGNEQWVLC